MSHLRLIDKPPDEPTTAEQSGSGVPCNVHRDTDLIPTRLGWVCPKGCGYEAAGRLWRDLPPVEGR